MTNITNCETIQEAMELSGSNFNVIDRPMMTCNAKGEPVMFPGKKIILRDDIEDESKAILYHCTTGYHQIQNIELFKFMKELKSKGDIQWTDCTVMQGGQKILISAKNMTKQADILKDDPIEQNFGIANGHGGKLSLSLMFFNGRLACSNQLPALFRDAQAMGKFAEFHQIEQMESLPSIIRLRHSRNILENLKLAQEKIDLSLAKIPMNSAKFDEYIKRVFSNELNDAARNNIKAFHRYEQLVANLEMGRGTDYKGFTGSLYGGLNAITEHLSHQYGTDKNRHYSAHLGKGATVIQRAADVAMAMA